MATPRVQLMILGPGSESGSQHIYPFGEHEGRLGRSESGLLDWETLPKRAELRLQVSPGPFLPKSTCIEIEGLTIRDHVLSQ